VQKERSIASLIGGEGEEGEGRKV